MFPFSPLQIGLALAGGMLAGYASCVEPHWVEITRLELTLPRLPSALDGITLAHLSDIHMGRFMSGRKMRRFVRAINELHPDLVVVTGDMVHRKRHEAESCARELAGLRAPLGVYLVPGNHERRYFTPEEGGEPYRRVGLVWLCNSARRIARDGASFWLVGLDDLLHGGGDIRHALRGVPDDTCKVVLVHEPDLAGLIARHGADLQLSGHTHGGQICLPGIGAIILPNLGHRYPAGLYKVDGMWLYTNRGLGTASLPMRLNCRPEIALLTLRSMPCVGETGSAKPWSEYDAH